MADGYDCTCAAHSENECCCGADWTPQELYDLRDKLTASKQREAELLAHVERLRRYITRILEYWTQDGNNQELFDMLCHIEETVKAELAATPEQSLARLRNGVLDEAANAADEFGAYCLAGVIRAMKEPE